MSRTVDELLNAGYEEIIEAPKKKPAKSITVQKKRDAAPYVVVDNSDQLKEMAESNALMRQALNEMVTKISDIGQRPKSLNLDIKRTTAGFMDNVKITLEY